MPAEEISHRFGLGGSTGQNLEKHTSQRIVLKFGDPACLTTGSPLFALPEAVSQRSKGQLTGVCLLCCSNLKEIARANDSSTLLKATREAVKLDSTKYDALVTEILREHISIVHFISQELAEKLVQDMTAECQGLKQFLKAMPKTGAVTPEDEDRVVSVGEKLSSLYVAALLEDHGVKTEYVDLSTVINFKISHGLSQDFYRDLAQAIGQRLRDCGDKVPVVTGFFGSVPGGLLNNCGRGYSDLCAALIAVGTEARELQVWKEVSGVYTADPRKVPTARLLHAIHPSEANELTFYGPEVIHHFTIEQCIPKIPIRIKNVLEPKAAGTVIYLDNSKKLDPYQNQRPKRPTAVTVKQQITVVNVHSHRKVESPEFLAEICKILARWSLAVNLFELNECHVSLAVHSKTPFIKGVGAEDEKDFQTQHQDLQSAIQELKEYGAVEVVYDMAILSLIGLQLKRSIGIAGKMFTALGNNNINIEMISQGASEINISCVVAERDAVRALNVVHTDLFTFLD